MTSVCGCSSRIVSSSSSPVRPGILMSLITSRTLLLDALSAAAPSAAPVTR
jgi:hypothetical protein